MELPIQLWHNAKWRKEKFSGDSGGGLVRGCPNSILGELNRELCRQSLGQSISAAFGAGRKQVTGLGCLCGYALTFGSGRKLRPVEQWCVSSPRQSMVPLDGGKNIGEVAPGSSSGRASIPFGSVHNRGSKAVRSWTASNQVVQVYESPTSQSLPSLSPPSVRSDSACCQHARGQSARRGH